MKLRKSKVEKLWPYMYIIQSDSESTEVGGKMGAYFTYLWVILQKY